MDFDFSDDQEMLRDTVRRWVERGYDFERRRAVVKAGGFSREAWQEIADLGICGLQVPEAQGGLGLGAGRRDGGARRARPRPGPRAVRRRRAGRDEPAQGRPRAGGRAAPAAHRRRQGDRRPRARGTALALPPRATSRPPAHGSGHAWRLSGTQDRGAGRRRGRAPSSSRRASAARSTTRPASASSSSRRASPASRCAPIRPRTARAAPTSSLKEAAAIELVAPGAAFAALEHAADIGIAALCAEAVGAMDKLVAITVEYMNTRKQFGVADRQLPGAAPPHRRRQDAARAGALDELLRDASSSARSRRRGGARWRRRRSSSAPRCASSASSASSCTAASASPTNTPPATTSSG